SAERSQHHWACFAPTPVNSRQLDHPAHPISIRTLRVFKEQKSPDPIYPEQARTHLKATEPNRPDGLADRFSRPFASSSQARRSSVLLVALPSSLRSSATNRALIWRRRRHYTRSPIP